MTEPLRYPLTRFADGWLYGPWVLGPATWTRPHHSVDWDWNHEDYDGPGDTRCGTAADRGGCIAAIHEWEDGHD